MTSKKTHSHSHKAKVALGHPLVSAAFWEDASRMGCWAASQKTRAMPPASEPGASLLLPWGQRGAPWPLRLRPPPDAMKRRKTRTTFSS